MCIYSECYFHVAMPYKTLTDIHIDTTLRTPRHKGVPQVVKLMRRAKLLEYSAHHTRLIRKDKLYIQTLRPLPFEQLADVREHI